MPEEFVSTTAAAENNYAQAQDADAWRLWNAMGPEDKIMTIFSTLTVERGIEIVRLIRAHLQERLQAEITEQSQKQMEHQEKLNKLHADAEKLNRLTQLF